MKKTFGTKTMRAGALLGIVALALALSGCGISQRHILAGVSQDELSAGGEPYFNAGGITYQIQESRAINPFDTQDVQYFAGDKSAQNIPASKFWFGVFLWAKNQNKRPLQTSFYRRFAVVDSQGNVYPAFPLNPTLNPYAWTQQTLQQDQIEPNPDSTAASGPTNGGLILFQLPESAYQNRPLTLELYAPGSGTPAKVSLDL